MDRRSREVIDVPAEGHYAITLDGKQAGLVAYERNGTTMTFTHTEIDPAERGHGVGGDLVMGVLEDMRFRGLDVVPQCSFFKHWMNQHPEYDDLVKK